MTTRALAPLLAATAVTAAPSRRRAMATPALALLLAPTETSAAPSALRFAPLLAATASAAPSSVRLNAFARGGAAKQRKAPPPRVTCAPMPPVKAEALARAFPHHRWLVPCVTRCRPCLKRVYPRKGKHQEWADYQRPFVRARVERAYSPRRRSISDTAFLGRSRGIVASPLRPRRLHSTSPRPHRGVAATCLPGASPRPHRGVVAASTACPRVPTTAGDSASTEVPAGTTGASRRARGLRSSSATRSSGKRPGTIPASACFVET